ncbi:hypothetical protein CWI75_17695 [Kineobactrum sediminis]|uniref:Uncharacterized protein n=1 Tax=Kineobactrum sediminis TaxID=1905677 RepID=A0A2N5XXY7_9GAMM|nr:hypothetical protein [Kineobactrum sediminis]PLW81011.1 hypothetical protein CWI75_17695 [Kineobactrum sediminis]
MLERPVKIQRYSAAAIVTVSGVWQISGLWRFRLTDEILLMALSGSIYLLLAIGLFGRSRFTLFMTIGICGTFAILPVVQGLPWPWTPLQLLRTASDLLVVILCARALWAVRYHPSI